MDQHWKSVIALVHNQRTSSSEKSGGMHHQILHYLAHKLSQVWKHIRRYRINVKIWDFKACCRDLGLSTVGGARDLTQQIKLIEIGDFQYK